MRFYPFSNQICQRPTVYDDQFAPELDPLLSEAEKNMAEQLGFESRGMVSPTYEATYVASVWVGRSGSFEHPVLLFHGSRESFQATEPSWAVGRLQAATVETIENAEYSTAERAERYMRFALSKQYPLASCLVWLCHMHTRTDVRDVGSDVPEAVSRLK